MKKKEILKMFEELSDAYASLYMSDYSVDEDDEEEYRKEHLERVEAFEKLLNED